MKILGTYLFIVLHALSWSMLPCGNRCSPSILISLQIWVHAGGSKSLHGETRSHATWSECSSFKQKLLPMIILFFGWDLNSMRLLLFKYPLNNYNIQLTSLGVVPSIGPLWENGHNTNSKNFIFKYLIISLKHLQVF